MTLLLRWMLVVVGAAAQPFVVKRWPLDVNLPSDMSVDGSMAGPPGAVFCSALEPSGNSNTKNCHNPNSQCNICYTRAPHQFWVQWCASTLGYRGITCSLDVAYRSPEGPRHGLLQYALAGTGAAEADFTNASSDVFPDVPYAFSNFAPVKGATVIATVYQLSMAEGSYAGDNLPLTATQGFCCRATFWGGNTVTGTFYVGDLDIRANARASPPPPAAASLPYSGAAVTGSVAGGALLGAALAVGGYAFVQYRASGTLPVWLNLAAWWG